MSVTEATVAGVDAGWIEMADSVTWQNLLKVGWTLPTAQRAFGCYDNGRYANYAAVAKSHPGSSILDFSVYLANVGSGGDVEPGDMNPAQGAQWVVERRASGVVCPVGYASIGGWMPELARLVEAAGVPWPGGYRRLSAHYGWGGQLPGLRRGEHICGPSTCGGLQCDGTQWIDVGPYDLSVLSAGFFGAAPVSPPPAPGWAGALAHCVGVASPADGGGYWLVAADGGVFAHGDAAFDGSEGGKTLAAGIVGVAAHAAGYWLVGSDGGVFCFGDAPFKGSPAGVKLVAPVVGVAGTPSGGGYWLVAADGGVFNYGDANLFGTAAGSKLAKPIVGVAAHPTGVGYWLVASDGGVFAFGASKFKGSTASLPLVAPIVGVAATPSGNGYWLVAADGGVFCFGDAGFHGGLGHTVLDQPIVAMSASKSGGGYTLVASDGGVFCFGDAKYFGAGSGSK